MRADMQKVGTPAPWTRCRPPSNRFQPVVEPVPARAFYHDVIDCVKDLGQELTDRGWGRYDAPLAIGQTRTRGAAVLSRAVRDIGNWIF